MIQDVEDYLAAMVSAGNLDPAPGVFTGTSAAIRSEDLAEHAVLCIADDVQNVVGNLYRAQVKVLVSSPPDHRDEHATLARALVALIEAAGPADEEAQITVNGSVIRSVRTMVEEDARWVTSVEAVLGVKLTTGD